MAVKFILQNTISSNKYYACKLYTQLLFPGTFLEESILNTSKTNQISNRSTQIFWERVAFYPDRFSTMNSVTSDDAELEVIDQNTDFIKTFENRTSRSAIYAQKSRHDRHSKMFPLLHPQRKSSNLNSTCKFINHFIVSSFSLCSCAGLENPLWVATFPCRKRNYFHDES